MKLVAVVAAAAVSSALAACTIKTGTTTCVEANCKYVPKADEVPEQKAIFGCFLSPISECKNGVSEAIAGASARALKCLRATKADTKAKAACANVPGTDGKCQDRQERLAAAAIPARDAKCVQKTCSDYPKEADCKAQSGCEFKAEVTGTVDTYKCKSHANNVAAKKTLCEAVEAVTDRAKIPAACGNAANGGSACCLVEVVKGTTGSPAMCVAKASPTATVKKASATTTVANAGTAVLSAFAAVSAALLM